MSRRGDDDETHDLDCFVIGPIGDRLAPSGSPERDIYEQAVQVWEEVIQPACDRLGVTPIRADRIARPGEITDQVFRLLRDADVVIADVTGGNPNVMYELGIRHTKNRLTIPLGERERLPFDINVIRTIRFNRSERGLIEAREALRAALEAGLKGEFDPVTATRVWAEAAMNPVSEQETQASDESSTEEEPGFLELLVESEEAMPRLTDSLVDRPTHRELSASAAPIQGAQRAPTALGADPTVQLSPVDAARPLRAPGGRRPVEVPPGGPVRARS